VVYTSSYVAIVDHLLATHYERTLAHTLSLLHRYHLLHRF
jgi:hypothetical protein